MGYKDITFCMHWQACAHGESCGRALTPAVEAEAAKWWADMWGEDAPCEAPIAIATHPRECYEEATNEATQ